jgi:pectate lyase
VDGVGIVGDRGKQSMELPAWVKLNRTWTCLDQPAAVAPVATHSAEATYKLVLNQAGCFPRDRVTTRTIREVAEGTGKWGRNAPAAPGDDWFFTGLKQAAPLVDTDADGIPDEWEDAQGLDKLNSSDNNRILASGYTAIEEYVNQRAKLLVETTSAY